VYETASLTIDLAKIRENTDELRALAA